MSTTPNITEAKAEQFKRDQTAWDTYVLIGNWVKVAEQLGYANGSVARRAAHRHATRNLLSVQRAQGSPTSADA